MTPNDAPPLSEEETIGLRIILESLPDSILSPAVRKSFLFGFDRLVAERDEFEKGRKHAWQMFLHGLACEDCKATRQTRLREAMAEAAAKMTDEQMRQLIEELENEPVYSDEDLELASERDARLNAELVAERDSLLAENEQLKDECARLRTDVAVADYIRRVAKTIDECGGWSQLDKPWKARRLKAAINIATMTKAEFEAAIDLARKAQGGE